MPAPTAENFDLDAAINAVGAATEGAEAPAATSAEPAATLPPVDEDIPLPKAWKKELEAHWKAAPKELREYVAKQREPDVQRGVQMYREGHERWSKLLTPYQEILAQYPDVDPVNLLNGLMQTHLRLSFGTPEEKRAMAQQLLQAYQVQLEEAAATGQQPPAIPPELDQRIARLEQDRVAEQRKAVMTQVETFFADPKNEYAKDVANEILGFVQKGHSLAEAYNLAIWSNPAVRAKLVAKEQAEAATSAAKLNVGAGGSDNSPPAPRKGTMEDTMQAVISKHFGTVNL